MTLLDAPIFDEVSARRRRRILQISSGSFVVFMISWWLLAGLPVDFPWSWNHFLHGRSTANRFLAAVEKDDLPTAYAIWMHDLNWQKHPADFGPYPYERFQADWSRTSSQNEYGIIRSHKIVAARMYGNSNQPGTMVLLMAIYINGRKSKPLDLVYDPRDKTLSFAPEGVELYLGP